MPPSEFIHDPLADRTAHLVVCSHGISRKVDLTTFHRPLPLPRNLSLFVLLPVTYYRQRWTSYIDSELCCCSSCCFFCIRRPDNSCLSLVSSMYHSRWTLDHIIGQHGALVIRLTALSHAWLRYTSERAEAFGQGRQQQLRCPVLCECIIGTNFTWYEPDRSDLSKELTRELCAHDE